MKPIKWRSSRDAELCVACAEPFKRGDLVINDGCLTIHYTKACVNQYNKDLEELQLVFGEVNHNGK